MIKGLEIENFLSHKKTSLEFSKGVNVIVGPTDSGKSAIIKALKWVVTNRPLGDGMRSYWGGATNVSVKFEKREVLRARGGKENTYMTKYDGDSRVFNAVKGEVPQEIAQLLQLNEVNLQTQFAPHFLLSQSSGDVAQYFNKVAHLDKIDVASHNIRKWTKQIQQSIAFHEDEVKEQEEKLKEFDDLEEIQDRVEELEKLEVEWVKLNRQCETITSTINDIEDIEDQLEGLDYLKELELRVDVLIALSNDIHDTEVDINDLDRFIKNILSCDEEVKSLATQITKLEEEFHDSLEGSECPLCGSLI